MVVLDFIKTAAPVASGTFALTRLWDRHRDRSLEVRAGLYKGVDPLTKQVVAKDVLAWDVLGQDAHVDLIYLQVVRPRERLAKLCAKFQGRPLDETIVMPARLEGPAFPHVLVGRGTWFVPPEDVYPYVAMAGIDRRFKLRPIAVVRRGSKSRVVRGNDIRPLLAKLQAAA